MFRHFKCLGTFCDYYLREKKQKLAFGAYKLDEPTNHHKPVHSFAKQALSYRGTLNTHTHKLTAISILPEKLDIFQTISVAIRPYNYL